MVQFLKCKGCASLKQDTNFNVKFIVKIDNIEENKATFVNQSEEFILDNVLVVSM